MTAYVPEDLDAYFAEVGEAIESFAAKHGLLLEKYYHDSPSWSLGFGHPKGGQAKLEVSALSPEATLVSCVWWIAETPCRA